MTRVSLKGIHRVRSRLADGTVREYHYAWRGGPRLEGKPGDPAYVTSYSDAHKARKTAPPGTVFSLIAAYRASSEFTKTAEKTQKDYGRYLRLIEEKFGSMPIEALSDPRVRGVFKGWRDEMSATPRKADGAWTMLARVLSVAKDRGEIAVNPCERGGRLYEVDRRDVVWTDELIAQFEAAASAPLRIALLAALWTGQRQGDLLALQWKHYDGRKLRLRPAKGGTHSRRVAVPAGRPLRDALDRVRQARRKEGIPTEADNHILLNTHGEPWTSDGFRTSWAKARAAAGIDALFDTRKEERPRFHDLRGSAVTRLALAGCSVPEIASVTGHSLTDVEEILEAHYLGRDVRLAEGAVRKLERKANRMDRKRSAKL